MPQDEDDNDAEGGGLVGAGDHNLSTNCDNRSSVGEFAVDLNGDRDEGESGSQRGSSLLDEVFSDEFFQVFEYNYLHVRDSAHEPPGPADTQTKIAFVDEIQMKAMNGVKWEVDSNLASVSKNPPASLVLIENLHREELKEM